MRSACRVCLFLALLWLTGCSSTTFVYNRLDIILPWYLDDYVEFDDRQEEQLDLLLESFLDWHRGEELPRYIDLLADIESALDRPVTGSDVAGFYGDWEAAWMRLQDRSLSWMLELGESLSDQQMLQFLAQLQEQQEEFEEEYLDRSEARFREDSYEGLRDSLQDYLGRLDKAQRARLQAAADDLLRSDAVWLAERAAWLLRLEVILQRQTGWQQAIRDAIDNRDDLVSQRYLDTYRHNLAVIFSAVADVLNSRSPRQDRRLRAELRDLREDLQTLVGQG